jgi:hypothetical protein
MSGAIWFSHAILLVGPVKKSLLVITNIVNPVHIFINSGPPE